MKDQKKITHITPKGIILLSFIFILLSSSPVFAAYEVYTYGGGDFLYYILNGVAMIFKAKHIKALIVIAALLLTLMLVGRLLFDSFGSSQIYMGEGFFDMIKVSLLTLVALQVFTIPKDEVLIVDRSKPSQTILVADVPLIQAYSMHVTSLIGDVIGEMMEDVFSLPDAIRFRNHGVALGAKYTGEFMSIYPPDTDYSGYSGTYKPYLIYTALREYFMTCIFQELAVPNRDVTTSAAYNALFTSPDILNNDDIEKLGDTYNRVITGIKTGEPTMTCHDALPEIKAAWDETYDYWIEDVMKKIAGKTGFQIGESENPKDYIESVVNHYVPLQSPSAPIMIKNIAVVNTMKDGMLVFSSRTSSPDGLSEYLSKKKTGSGWMSAARMLNSIVILLRQIFEGLIYGLSILLPFLVVIGGIKAFTTYLKLLLWLNLWVPFFVVLNLLADLRYLDSLNDLTDLAIGGAGFNFRNIEDIQMNANILLGIIGATAWTVPTLAWGLVSGGVHAISSVIQNVTSKGEAFRTSSQAGAEISGAGNISVAQKSIGSESIMSSDAITSTGARVGGWAHSMSTMGVVNEMGLSGYSGALESQGIYNASLWQQVGAGGSSSLGTTAGQALVGTQSAIQAVADGHYNGNAAEMMSNFRTMEAKQKAELIAGIAKSLGISPSMAATVAGEIAGKMGSVGSMTNKGLLDKHGPDNLRKAAYGKASSQVSEALSALSYMTSQGYTPEQFGGEQGMLKTAQSIGNIEGFQKAYSSATQNGFTGSEKDFMGLVSEMSHGQSFAQSGKMQDLAQTHFNGNSQNMFKALAGYQHSKALGAINKAQQHGRNPETMQAYQGHMEALSSMGRAGGYALLGDKKFMSTESGKMLNEAAKFETITSASAAAFDNNKNGLSGKEMYQALLAHQGAGVTMALNNQQAQQLGLSGGAGKYSISQASDGSMVFSKGAAGQQSYKTISEPTSFTLPSGNQVSLVSGKIEGDGIMQRVTGNTSEGLGVSFNHEQGTGDVWNMKVDPNMQLGEDGAYRLMTDSGGSGFSMVDMANPTVGERFVNNYANTIGQRMGASLRNNLGGSISSSMGKALGSIGVNVGSAKVVTDDLIAGSISLAYQSSFKPDGTFDHNKFSERANTLRDIYWAKNRGASMGFTSGQSTPENIVQGHSEPQVNQFFNKMLKDYNSVQSSSSEKVQNYERQSDSQKGGSW